MMMTDSLEKWVGTKKDKTHQQVQARNDQVQNNAGGFVFSVDDWVRLDRFLMLGTDGGTYYLKEQDHTQKNAQFIIELAQKDAASMVERIVAVSLAGRAPRQKATLFSLAAASIFGNLEGRQAAYAALPKVARTGSMLFQFITYREMMGGWSRGLRRAVGNAWYNLKPAEKLAYQMVKYRTRNNWSHRDLLRLAHPKPQDDEHNHLYAWAVGKDGPEHLLSMPQLIREFEDLQEATEVHQVVATIETMESAASWEMIPDKFINEPAVWRSLFRNGIPQTALIRQLPRLTRLGMFDRLGTESGGVFTDAVIEQIKNSEKLKRARVHPMNLLIAQKAYSTGRSKSTTWTPSPDISQALSDGFYAAFDAVEPTGKNIMLAVDVSGSMTGPVGGLDMMCLEAAAAIALVTKATEKNAQIYAFSDGRKASGRGWGSWDQRVITPLNINPSQRIDDVFRYMQGLDFGRTDLALPMTYAYEHNLHVDAFVIYTDNETWYGGVHPFQALKQYRERFNKNAKLVVVSLTATPFSIADPLDPGMIDFVGFDANVVTAINDFIREG